MVPRTLASLLGLAFVLVVCLFSVLVGGWRARRAALTVLAGVGASIAAQHLSPEWAPLAPLTLIDLTVLVLLVWLAWKPKRSWSLAAVGCQGLVVALDALKALDPQLHVYIYLTAVTLTTYALVAVVGYGAWVSRNDPR